MRVTDADAGPNGDVFFTRLDGPDNAGNDLFDINTMTGKLSVPKTTQCS